MAVNAKAIKQRIKSVKNTQKMTRAMEMVSAAKMRKASEAALQTRFYATLAHDLMEQLSTFNPETAAQELPPMPLLERRPIERVLVILVSSNRGLCGSYNSNVFKTTRNILLRPDVIGTHQGESVNSSTTEQPMVHIVGVGKKSAAFAKTHGYTLEAVFDTLSDTPTYEEILPIAQLAIQGYVEKTYDRVMIAYTEFITTLSQEVAMRQVLPISSQDLATMIEAAGDVREHKKVSEPNKTTVPVEQYVFEPNPATVLTYMLPKLVEIQLFQGVLESAASEHSSRMIAMKNATDNAGEMVKDLTLTYNKARQAAITQEIAEIVGGAAALE